MSPTIVHYTSEIRCDHSACPAVVGSQATWRMTTGELRAMAHSLGWAFQVLHHGEPKDFCPKHDPARTSTGRSTKT